MSPHGAHVMRVITAGIAHSYFAANKATADDDSSQRSRRACGDFTSPGASFILGF